MHQYNTEVSACGLPSPKPEPLSLEGKFAVEHSRAFDTEIYRGKVRWQGRQDKGFHRSLNPGGKGFLIFNIQSTAELEGADSEKEQTVVDNAEQRNANNGRRPTSREANNTVVQLKEGKKEKEEKEERERGAMMFQN